MLFTDVGRGPFTVVGTPDQVGPNCAHTKAYRRHPKAVRPWHDLTPGEQKAARRYSVVYECQVGAPAPAMVA